MMKKRKRKPRKLKIPNSTDCNSFRATENSFHGVLADQKLTINADGMSVSPPTESPAKRRKSIVKDFHELDIGNQLGTGQSSVVRSCIHRPTGTKLAVKIMNIWEKKNRRQTCKEIQALGKIAKNQNLIVFHTAFFRSGSVYLVLDYMDCGSLADVLEKVTTVPEPILRQITRSIIKGLEYLHGVNIVHRDLKPSNICLNREGKIKLSDFGISRELESTFVKCRTACGTMSYMSPERILSQEYGFPSDIWALGISILECALGRFPYEASKSGVYMELIEAITDGEPEKAPKYYSQEFQDFLDFCLIKNPSHRPSTTELLKHPWMKAEEKPLLEDWVRRQKLVL